MIGYMENLGKMLDCEVKEAAAHEAKKYQQLQNKS
jgi:hypothetical protein